MRVLARRAEPNPDLQWAAGDLATGEGLAEALRGVHSVVHAATLSPIARRGSIRPIDFFTTPSEVDVEGTRRLLEASERAGVAHFLHVSIVGLEDSALPYSRVKLAGEHLVRQSPLAWSVVRATPFYYLTERMFAGLRWLPFWPLPNAPCNPVDTSDVAAHLAECLDDGRRGMREEIGGRRFLPFAEFARQYQRARHRYRPILPRPILPLRVSAKTARGMGLVEAQGRPGRKTWSSWLG